MTRIRWLNAVIRSMVWVGASACWAYLKKPVGASVLAVRLDAVGWVGVALFLAGWALHLWANASLARGEATPAHERVAPVAQGPYQYVRNPIYLAGAPILLGIYLLYSRWLAADIVVAVVLAMAFHLLVVRLEEPALRKRLGPAYDEYCRHVPRWIPRLARNR